MSCLHRMQDTGDAARMNPGSIPADNRHRFQGEHFPRWHGRSTLILSDAHALRRLRLGMVRDGHRRTTVPSSPGLMWDMPTTRHPIDWLKVVAKTARLVACRGDSERGDVFTGAMSGILSLPSRRGWPGEACTEFHKAPFWFSIPRARHRQCTDSGSRAPRCLSSTVVSEPIGP